MPGRAARDVTPERRHPIPDPVGEAVRDHDVRFTDCQRPVTPITARRLAPFPRVLVIGRGRWQERSTAMGSSKRGRGARRREPDALRPPTRTFAPPHPDLCAPSPGRSRSLTRTFATPNRGSSSISTTCGMPLVSPTSTSPRRPLAFIEAATTRSSNDSSPGRPGTPADHSARPRPPVSAQPATALGRNRRALTSSPSAPGSARPATAPSRSRNRDPRTRMPRPWRQPPTAAA